MNTKICDVNSIVMLSFHHKIFTGAGGAVVHQRNDRHVQLDEVVNGMRESVTFSKHALLMLVLVIPKLCIEQTWNR